MAVLFLLLLAFVCLSSLWLPQTGAHAAGSRERSNVVSATLLELGNYPNASIPLSVNAITTTWYVSSAPLGSGTFCAQALPCATINQAIANAASGDTIEVAAGTYDEHDLIVDKSLTINGSGANTTIVDAQQQGRIFLINAGVTVSISNLTITGGKALDGVVSPGPFEKDAKEVIEELNAFPEELVYIDFEELER